MNWKKILIPALVVGGIVTLVVNSARVPVAETGTPALTLSEHESINKVVAEIDAHFENEWNEFDLTTAAPAGELTVLRRLSLALHGTIPSLEEIREFETDSEANRLDRWTERMLHDNRFPDYISERLARSFVGTEGGPFVIFRRDRFVNWLGDQIRDGAPYDEMVRLMVADSGLWTGSPAVNFVTVGFANNEFDQNKITGRAVRAFLGQRIDCAQCHDHPFEKWKLEDFEGLAAHFGQVKLSPVGLEDNPEKIYEVEDRETQEKREVAPRVPFNSEWVPAEGGQREKLAAWITHPKNRRFERAIANRIWGLMFGRSYLEPVDDLPDPEDDSDLLGILGRDFRENDYDLRRLVRVISKSRAFRMDSIADLDEGDSKIGLMEDTWAVFPLLRLRPEQLIGSMYQASSVKTVDQNSHLFIRFLRFVQGNNFVQEFGDLGEDELESATGTIPQALLRMNGEIANQASNENILRSGRRISMLAPTDEQCLELCYLVCLSRRPTPEESAHFLDQLREVEGQERHTVVGDIIWSLFNSPEFSWNH